MFEAAAALDCSTPIVTLHSRELEGAAPVQEVKPKPNLALPFIVHMHSHAAMQKDRLLKSNACAYVRHFF